MPLARVHEIPVSSIWVDSPERDRREFGSIEELAQSIAANGLINFPVVTREAKDERPYKLVAGERRLRAVTSLGWPTITVHLREELSLLEQRRIEFDENAKRLDLTWQERCIAVDRYHQLSVELNGPEWTQQDTADELGITMQHVGRNIRITRALDAGNEVIRTSPTLSTALGILERQETRRRDSNLAQVDALIRRPSASITSVIPKVKDPVDLESASDLDPEPDVNPAPILNGDFLLWSKTYSGPAFNLLHCDFPYGIEATEDKNKQYAKGFGEYEDAGSTYIELLHALAAFMKSGVAESAHMLFWYAAKTYTETFRFLTDMGWRVTPTPLIWHRSDGSGILPDPKRGPRQTYETAFLCARGDRFITRAKANLISSPATKKWHMSEKPLPVLDHFLSMLTDDSTILLDPTCGSGNALIAGKRLGARHILGIEKLPDFFSSAQQNWKEATDEDEADAA